MTPVFFAFTDRQKIYDLVEAITGFRMHPAWFRIGGVAHDLPNGWERLLREFLDWMPKRLDSYVKAALNNSILKGRSIGVASSTMPRRPWSGASPVLACAPPVSSSTCANGVRIPATRTSTSKSRSATATAIATTRVMLKRRRAAPEPAHPRAVLNNMPEGPFKADHPLTTPPPKERTLQHIETLITHFLQVSWGPVMPANESFQMIEATKGINSYYLTSDGSTMSYRTRVRTPSFAHLQQIPSVIRGSLVSDLIVVSG
jgi:NADH-quinone oxidoreductase subunit C/D